jgi:outer membrane protein
MKTPMRPKYLVIAMALLSFQSIYSFNAVAQEKSPVPMTSNSLITSSPIISVQTVTLPRLVDAANPKAKDLIQLFQDAAQFDPIYNTAKYAYTAGKEAYWQAFSVLLPQINATYSTQSSDIRYDPNLNNIANRKDYTFSNSGWGLNLTQPLFNWSYFEKYKQGDLLTGVAEANFAQAQQDLIVRVSQAYFDALTAQDTLDLFINKKGLINEQLQQAKRNFEVGTATIVDTNEAQSRYDLVIAQEIAAQSDLLVKKSALEQIIGQPVDAIFPLSKQAKVESLRQERTVKYLDDSKGKLASNDIIEALHLSTGNTIEDWVRQTEEVNYNVIVGRLNTEIAKSNYRSVQGTRLPVVSLQASTGYNNSLGNATSSLPNTYYANQIGLQFSVPIFTGGLINSNARQTAALYDQSIANLDFLKKSNAVATKQAYLGFTNGIAQIKAYEAAEKSALTSLQSNRTGYNVGVRINIDVLNAQDQLITTQSSLYKARYDAIMNGIKLKSLSAVLTDDDVIAVNKLLH